MEWKPYIIRALPAILVPGILLSSDLAQQYLECRGTLKDIIPCYVGGTDIGPLLRAGVWWGGLLWLPSVLLSVALLGKQIERDLNQAGHKTPKLGLPWRKNAT